MLWIFLPAYNEEDSLPRLLRRLDGTLREHRVEYRLVVLNDGSRDRTDQILKEFTPHLPLEIVTHPINRGLGETERDGFEYICERCASTDVIVRLEGDDTHDPAYLLHLTEKLADGFDVVNTSRFQPGGGQIGVDRLRAFLSRMANVFMGLIFNIRGIRDYSCGYRVYRASVIQDALRIYGNNFIQLRGLGFTSTLEIIVKLRLLGCRFAEVPFVLRYDQKSSPSKMVASVTTLGYLIMTVLYYWPWGGWLSQYRGLRKMYPQDAAAAVERFASEKLRRRTVSRISF
jgi:dolichol-phosphate mannosyltransferase